RGPFDLRNRWRASRGPRPQRGTWRHGPYALPEVFEGRVWRIRGRIIRLDERQRIDGAALVDAEVQVWRGRPGVPRVADISKHVTGLHRDGSLDGPSVEMRVVER